MIFCACLSGFKGAMWGRVSVPVMKKTSLITETLISPIDRILSFTAQLSCSAAALHIEHHMVWPCATFSCGHRGTKLQMGHDRGSGWCCRLCCYSNVCEIISWLWISPVICYRDATDPCPLLSLSWHCGILHACRRALDSHATALFSACWHGECESAHSQNVLECVPLSSDDGKA